MIIIKNYLEGLDYTTLEDLAMTQEELKYKNLCEKLGIKCYSGGNAKTRQLEQLAAICELGMHTKPTRYYIAAIREEIDIEALIQIHGRWWPYFAAKILDLLKEKNTLFITTSELLRQCTMINRNFITALDEKNRKPISVALKYSTTTFSTFIDKTYNSILRPIVRDVLAALQKKAIIEVVPAYAFKIRKGDDYINTTVLEPMGKKFLEIENRVVRETGIDIGGYVPSYLWGLFYQICGEIAREELGIYRFFRCHSIVSTDNIINYYLPPLQEALETLNRQAIENVFKSKSLYGVPKKDKEKFVNDTMTPTPEVDYKAMVKKGREDFKNKFHKEIR